MIILDYLKKDKLSYEKFPQWAYYSTGVIHFDENKINENFIETKKLFSIIKQNKTLFNNYLGGEDFNILNKMIAYNLKNNRICSFEQIDNLVEDKIILCPSVLDVIKNINKFSTKYTMYMEKPWTIFSPVELIYTDIDGEVSISPSNKYKYFLELFIIKDELLPIYIKELKKELKISNENLATMIIFYANNDAHMDTCGLPKINNNNKKP